MIAIHPEHTSASDPVAGILDQPVSASRINLFHSCRLKFYFRYVLKLKKPASPALHVGKTVHAMLQEWSRRRWMGKPASSDSLLSHFDEHWQLSLENEPVAFEEDEEQVERNKAWGLVEMYLRETPISVDEKPMGVEVSVERDLSEHGLPSLRGIIDLVRANGEIVDFKTSATTPNEEQVLHRNLLQLTIYGLLYRHSTCERETGFELHHLVKTNTPKLVVTGHPPITDREQGKLFRSIESFVDGGQRGLGRESRLAVHRLRILQRMQRGSVVSRLTLFPRIHFCAECGKPGDLTSRWNPFGEKVRCTSGSENWGEVFGWH